MEERLELLPHLLMTAVIACLRDLRQGGVSQLADAGKLTPGSLLSGAMVSAPRSLTYVILNTKSPAQGSASYRA